MRQYISWIFIGGAFISLTACAGFNPQTAEMTQKNQCIALQRNILFAGNLTSDNNNQNQFQTNNQQLQMQQQFDKMHCREVLAPTPPANSSSPAAKPVTG